ncbi:MAG: ATP-binding protein [Ignavibacteriaceae bacterium]|jgi:PAS domain S-box-containing protein
MNKTISLVTKWRNLSIERKIVLGWIFSLLVVLSLSALIYLSKKELHSSTNVITLNANLSSATQDLLSTIHKLEITSKRFILSGSEKDSENYLENLALLKANMVRLERIIKDQPRLLKQFIPLKKIIQEELLNIDPLSFSLKTDKLLNIHTIKLEEDIFKKLEEYSELMDEVEDQITVEQVQGIQAKINLNLNYFLGLVVLYVLLLTALFAIILSDVRTRRVISRELAESRNRLNAIINTAASLIFVKDTKKKFTLVNKAFLEYFNITDHTSFFSSDNSTILQDDERQETRNEDDLVLTQREILKNIERMMIVNTDEQRWLSINKAPLIDKDDKVVGIVGVMDDITNRKMYEQELIETKEKLTHLNAQKDKLFSIIAHDLRSPFQGFIGMTEYLAEDATSFSPEELSTIGKEMNLMANNFFKLLTNLLEWARMQQGAATWEPKEIALAELINESIGVIIKHGEQKGITFNVEVSPQQKVFADEAMINSVVRNLLSNAIKFTKQGGKISVTSKETENNMVEIAVTDTGVGMPDEYRKKLFKLEEKVGRKGTDGETSTGLGLLLCKEFVEKNGGKIRVESELDKGSKFIFTVPGKENK